MSLTNEQIKLIVQGLENAGLMSVPESKDEDLIPHGLDSLIRAMAIIDFERKFKIRISPDDIDGIPLNTIQDFINLIESKLQ